MESQNRLDLKIAVFQDGECWVAHCLEFDVLTSDPDRSVVEKDIITVCRAQIQFAYANDLLHELFRPPNTKAATIIARGFREGSLEMRTEIVDGNGVDFRFYREAA